MKQRIGKTSRDIYDVWFFLENHFPINKAIVELRAGMPFDRLIDARQDPIALLPLRKEA